MRILWASIVLLVAGCGQTGALYLPEDKPAAQAGTPQQPAQEEPKKKDE